MRIIILILAVVMACPAVSAQSASYLDSIYQTNDKNAQFQEQEPDADPAQALKDQIYETYQIDIVDDETNRWSITWMNHIKSVLAALPEGFRSATKIITLEPGFLPFEVKYNGFDERDGEIIIGYGALVPPSLYMNKFKATYNRLPNENEKVARFKSILVRGMTYAFQQANPDIAKKWGQVYVAGEISTKVFGPGQDQNMIVSPVKSPSMVDMAFSVALYCAAASELKSKSSARHDYIKEYVMGGKSVSGWGHVSVNDGDSNNGNNDNNGSVETPGTKPPPEIPDGDYLPVVTEVDVGTAAATIPQEQHTAPDLLKSSIVELFADLPKFFSTCTEAIVYLPTTDTEAAFSSEGYVFITQNCWFAPTFVELTDESRAARFKAYLLREMTKRFLYYHPEVSKKWQETFAPNQTMFEVYVDLCEATVLYYQNPQYLKELNLERYNFIKAEVMKDKQFL